MQTTQPLLFKTTFVVFNGFFPIFLVLLFRFYSFYGFLSRLRQFFLLFFFLFPHSLTPSLFASFLMSFCSLSRKTSSKTLVSKLWFPIHVTSKPHFTSLSSFSSSSSSSKPSSSAYSEGKFRSNAQKLIAEVEVIEVKK